MNASLLVHHWQVCDAAKTHVSFAHAHAVRGTHRRERDRSFVSLRDAVQALTSARETVDPGEAPVSPTSAWGASLEQQSALELVAGRAERYVTACERYQRLGVGRAARDEALVALCRALDIVTFYRNGPQVKEVTPDAALPARTSEGSRP